MIVMWGMRCQGCGVEVAGQWLMWAGQQLDWLSLYIICVIGHRESLVNEDKGAFSH
jgi:hypothetical protein